MFTLHRCDVSPQFVLPNLSPVLAAAQSKQHRGFIRDIRVFQAGFAVCAEFYSVVLANLLSIPSLVF